jgi:predicted O-methyltransferase YrrM
MTTATHTIAWADCLAYLEAHCNPLPPPLLPESVRYAQVLWTLCEAIGATAVLEIGIGPTSVSGCTFMHSMATRGGGALVSIDVDPALPQPKFKAKAAELGVAWTTYYGDSLRMTLPSDLQVDLLYIDGDHDAAHAYGDTVRYLSHLKPGGYLVIDDSAYEGVIDAAVRLKREGMAFIHLSHHPPHGNGRFVWQKPL